MFNYLLFSKYLYKKEKTIVYKFILILFLILSNFLLSSQTVYKEFGTWKHVINNNTIVSLKAYITVDNVITISKEKLYVYSFNIISLSTINNSPTTTWLYGTRIFINDLEISKKNYPNGFMIGINTTPTFVYKYTTNDDKVKFSVDWLEAIADPRIRNNYE